MMTRIDRSVSNCVPPTESMRSTPARQPPIDLVVRLGTRQDVMSTNVSKGED